MQRQAVEVMRSEAAVSERPACGLVKLHRATCWYRRRRVEDPGLRPQDPVGLSCGKLTFRLL